jgi:hypothetical protein
VGGSDGTDGVSGGGPTAGRALSAVGSPERAHVAAERYVSRRELAELMGVSVDCVEFLVRLGMPSETWGFRRRVFKPSAALAWAREHGHRKAA